MTETMSGDGRVFKGKQFIADVHYELQIHSRAKMTRTHSSEGPYAIDNDSQLRISPATAISGEFGERLTLHLSNGHKQEFLVVSSSGECKPSGGPHP